MEAQLLTESKYVRLMQAAKDARTSAYAPYSHFPVGAAILFSDGEIITGCNVENASFGLTVCAERSAMCAAVAASKKHPLAVAIAGEEGKLCPPCGACRQFLYEFNPRMTVVLEDAAGLIGYQLSELLPAGFSADELGEEKNKCKN